MADARPILDQINLVSGDVAASVAFYRLLGLDIPDTHAGWDERHRSAVFDGAAGNGFGIDFDIDSAAFYATLTAAGHRGLRAPYDAFWGARYAIVADPDGVAVGLMSEPSDAHRSAPPEPTGRG